MAPRGKDTGNWLRVRRATVRPVIPFPLRAPQCDCFELANLAGATPKPKRSPPKSSSAVPRQHPGVLREARRGFSLTHCHAPTREVLAHNREAVHPSAFRTVIHSQNTRLSADSNDRL